MTAAQIFFHDIAFFSFSSFGRFRIGRLSFVCLRGNIQLGPGIPGFQFKCHLS